MVPSKTPEARRAIVAGSVGGKDVATRIVRKPRSNSLGCFMAFCLLGFREDYGLLKLGPDTPYGYTDRL